MYFLRDLFSAKLQTMSEKSTSSSKFDSILITDKKVSLGCNMQLLRWFLTSSENDRSPVQFVSILLKYIRNAISMFGNVDSRLSALIKLCSSDCWMRNFGAWGPGRPGPLDKTALGPGPRFEQSDGSRALLALYPGSDAY